MLMLEHPRICHLKSLFLETEADNSVDRSSVARQERPVRLFVECRL